MDSIPASYQGSFEMGRPEQRENENALLDICLLYCPFVLSNSMRSDGAGLQYVERDIKFFQVWTLDVNLGLSSSTFAIHDQSANLQGEPLSITAPTSRGRHSRRRFGAKVVAESFIVPNGEQDEDDIDHGRGNMEDNMQTVLLDEWENDVRFRIDWRRIYRFAFSLDRYRPALDDVPSIRSLLAYTSEHIHQGLENNELPTSTLTEISGFETVSEDTEGASQALQEFLRSLERERDASFPSTLVVSNVMRSFEDPESRNETENPDLWVLYDRLAEYWMASLPPGLTDIGRVARHRIIQQLAMDVCLSSVCISVENKLVSVENPLIQKEIESTSRTNLDRNSAFSRDSSPLFLSSQPGPMSSQEQRAAFPTPLMTPSEYSHTTSGSEVREDPAITRLRQYSRSIKSKPDLGEPSILSHWPSRPGANPALYSYQEAQKALLVGESGDESEHRNKKEEARRRRRTERFLRQEQSRAVEKAARSQFLPSGSQPAVSNNLTSSQTVADLPMTQPVLGIFGSRKGEKEKRKSKKKRTAGFR